MATGRKPKPNHLRLVDGTFRADRHGDRGKAQRAVERAAKSFGKLKMPKWLREDPLLVYAREAWQQQIAPAYWLDTSREVAALPYCHLWQEFRQAPNVFPAAKHNTMRAYAADLGLTDERNRGELPEPLPMDEFFDT